MENNNRLIIAVDGPAGSGKSTAAKIIAKKLNIEYVDSGSIYRGITKKILDNNIKIEDYDKIISLLKELDINLFSGNIIINGEDFTPYIRSKEVTELVSPVSANTDIRQKVNAFLVFYSENRSIIMDGRDIGTVVFPFANYKFYLDASVDIRALRRFKEGHNNMTLDEIKNSISKRDESDKNKSFGALKIADDAIYLDTTLLSIDEVVDKIISFIKYNGEKI